MKNNTIKKYIKTSKGQAVLFVVVGITIALVIGVSVVSRNLGSIGRVSRTDTSARAYAAAEGGIERLLGLTDYQLDQLIGTPSNSTCQSVGFSGAENGQCWYEFASEDKIISKTLLSVNSYPDPSVGFVSVELNPGETKEVVMYYGSADTDNYTSFVITLCWDNVNAAVSYSFYYPGYHTWRGILSDVNNTNIGELPFDRATCLADFKWYRGLANPEKKDYTRFMLANGASNPFPMCRIEMIYPGNPGLAAVNGFPQGLRLTALFDNTTVGVFRYTPHEATFQRQGYELTAKGTLSTKTQVVESKTVKVYRSLSHMPSFFDAAIFSAEGKIN